MPKDKTPANKITRKISFKFFEFLNVVCADKKIVPCTCQVPLGKVKTVSLGRNLEKSDIQHIVTLNCVILTEMAQSCLED